MYSLALFTALVNLDFVMFERTRSGPALRAGRAGGRGFSSRRLVRHISRVAASYLDRKLPGPSVNTFRITHTGALRGRTPEGPNKTSSRSRLRQHRRGLCLECVPRAAPYREEKYRSLPRRAGKPGHAHGAIPSCESPQLLNGIFVKMKLFASRDERAMPTAGSEYLFRVHTRERITPNRLSTFHALKQKGVFCGACDAQ